MNNDLISREALKKELIDSCIDETMKVSLPFVLRKIDNAPTVEPKLKDDIIEAFNLITDQEFENSDSFWIVTPKGKKIEFEKKRPQGEWVDKGKYAEYHSEHAYLCKNCGCQIIERPDKIFENWFCKFCGAYMKGVKEA